MCPKCGGREIGERAFSASGTGLTRVLDWNTNDFRVEYCKRCGLVIAWYVLDGKARPV